MIAQKTAQSITPVTATAPRLSWRETVRFHWWITLLGAAWGLVVPNRWLVPVLARFNVGRHAAQLIRELRLKYAGRDCWIWFPFGPTLLVMNASTRDAVLSSERNAADPILKRHALGLFVPEALVISSGTAWKERRAFNQSVLGFGERLHPHAPAFVEIVSRSIAPLMPQTPTDLEWRDFRALALRIAHQVILGSGCIDSQADESLSRMARCSNAYVLPRLRSEFRQLYARIDAHRRRHETLGQAVDDVALPGCPAVSQDCLLHDSSTLTKTRDTDQQLAVSAQIAFWLFVLKDALELHVPRTLALIAAHPAVQDRVRADIAAAGKLAAAAIDGLGYLEACIAEQLRLWTPVPILLRRIPEPNDLELPNGLSIAPGRQIMIHAAALHRDPDVFGDAAHRFAPDESATRATETLVFSAGRQSCAGQFLARFLLKATLAELLRRSRYALVGPRLDPACIPHTYNHFAIRLRPCTT